MKTKRAFGWMVLIIGLALCGKGLWMLFGPTYGTVLTIQIEPEAVTGLDSYSYVPYNSYFFDNDFKEMQSGSALSNVVETLNLDAHWGKPDGTRLGIGEAVDLLRRRLEIDGDEETRIVNIGVWDKDPDEAAQIADAIAEAYRHYRIERHGLQMKGLIEKLEHDYLAQETNILSMQSNVDELRNSFESTYPDSATLNTYEKDREQLFDAKQFHQQLGAKIQENKRAAIQIRSALMTTQHVVVPKIANAPNYRQAGVWLVCGLGLTGSGICLLRGSVKTKPYKSVIG